LWLNILAVRRQSALEIVRDHWAEYGRTYYSRHDYEAIETENANQLMAAIEESLDSLAGRQVGSLTIERADSFSYHDPVDGSVSRNQGLRIFFEGGARLVFRLSGTGTSGATLRVYMERHEPDATKHDQETQAALAPVIEAAQALAGIRKRTGRDAPTVIT
jgi:phosphoglucomutase